jgi:hypothetical protein
MDEKARPSGKFKMANRKARQASGCDVWRVVTMERAAGAGYV